MLFKPTLILPMLASFATIVAADNNCNTGDIHCCNEVHDANSAEGQRLLQQNGLAGKGITGQIGSTCSPITVAGVGTGNKCKSNAFCCQNNNFTGVIVVACNPIIIDL